MKLSKHYWYKGSSIVTHSEGYAVLINVSNLDNKIKKIIPHNYSGVIVQAKVEP